MKKAKKYYIYLGIIQIINAISAIPVGITFTVDPSGLLNGITTEILANSPFSNFLIPGILLIVLGVGNLFSALLSFQRINIASFAGILLGTAQILWITFHVAWIGLSSFLQPLFFVIGITEAVLGLIIYSKLRKQNQQMLYNKSI